MGRVKKYSGSTGTVISKGIPTMETGNRGMGETEAQQSTAAPLRSGAKKGPPVSNKRERSKYLADNPGRGERELRAAATTLGLTFECSPPIDRWFPDLVFRGAKLIVEVDGAYHFDPAQVAKDTAKDRTLRRAGWRVVRVWAVDAKRSPMDVLLGAFTQAFGLGEEETAMARCKGPRKKGRRGAKGPSPRKLLKAAVRAEEAAKRGQKKAKRTARDAQFNASAKDRYLQRAGVPVLPGVRHRHSRQPSLSAITYGVTRRG